MRPGAATRGRGAGEACVLEIAANSLASALAAQDGGADRIELCAALEIGGLTPSHAQIALVRERLSIPIHVLVRPRAGDFAYSAEEHATMLTDIAHCVALGCEGVVVGALDPDGEVDAARCRELADAAGGLDLTFHRAIDVSRDLLRSLPGLPCPILPFPHIDSDFVAIDRNQVVGIGVSPQAGRNRRGSLCHQNGGGSGASQAIGGAFPDGPGLLMNPHIAEVKVPGQHQPHAQPGELLERTVGTPDATLSLRFACLGIEQRMVRDDNADGPGRGLCETAFERAELPAIEKTVRPVHVGRESP